MSRKRKRGRKHRALKDKRPATLDALERKANADLAARHHRDAISAYKDLLKRERRPQWIEGLAAAYRGRAEDLAEKGMIKEAIAIWQNRASACDGALAEPFYFRLLCQAGRIGQAVDLLREQQKLLEQRGYLTELRAQLAAQTLARQEDVIQGLPKDDPVMRDYPLAVEALQIYCRGDDAKVQAQLTRIPFRSPYRDLRQVLKALTLLHSDPGSAVQRLERIPVDSPFAGLAAAACAAASSGFDAFRDLQSLGKEARHLVAALRGWSEQQLAAFRELAKLGESPGPKLLLRFLLHHREVLGETYVSEAAMKLLASYPDGYPIYAATFGEPSPFDLCRIEALINERLGPPSAIYDGWMEAVRRLDQAGARQGTEDGLRAALILRRAAEQCAGFAPLASEVIQALERSLQYDPDDRPTYLRLIAHYREAGKLNHARRWLQEALSRYADDIEVLIAAVETATAGQAFKKAAGFARRILAIDPINSQVRDILVDSHLAHGRKQIDKGKFTLARKELDQAGRWARSASAAARIELLRAMLELGAGDTGMARALCGSASEHLGGGLVGYLHVSLEAARLGRPMAKTLEELKVAYPSITRESVLAVIHEVSDLHDQDQAILMAAIETLEPPLKQAVKLRFSQSEMELVCEMLRRLQQHELRKSYARAALKRWADAPVFIFHRVDAEHDSWVMALSDEEVRQLEAAFERAREEGDQRTAHRIGELLDGRPSFVQPEDSLPPPPQEREALQKDMAEIVDQIGMDGAVEMMLNSADPKEIEALKAALGPEGLRGILEAFVRGELTLDNLDVPADGAPSSLARKPKKRRTTAKGQPSKKITNVDQFDLF